MSKLNKVLDTFLEETEDLWDQFMEGDDPDVQKYDDFLDNAYTGAKQQIKALMLELIGEDENPGIDPEWPMSKVKRRDDLRAELRQKVEKL